MASALVDESFDMDKLSYEIFSILESKFLFSDSSPPESPLKSLPPASGKVRILSIDAAPDGAVLAALSLYRLESLLKKHTENPAASVADFFDVAAGSGAGGVLAAMLFSRGRDGRPLFTAEASLRFLSSRSINGSKNGVFRKIFRKRGGGGGEKFKKMFGEATVREFMKPTLISCFDLVSGSPFMFSRSDAVESDGYDFLIKDVCAATCGVEAVEVRSVDGGTSIRAVGGGVGMGNPAAAAITHVLNNKREFPFADGPEDLFVLSLGSAEPTVNIIAGNRRLITAKMVKIAGELGAADTVDQSVAMAFGQYISTNYVRIQSTGLLIPDDAKSTTGVLERAGLAAEAALSQKHIESVMFRGKKISEQTNMEKIELVTSCELIKEHDRRKRCPVPTVLIKPAMASPRTSSATMTSTATLSSSC